MNTIEAGAKAAAAIDNLRPGLYQILVRGIVTIGFFVSSGIFFVISSPNYAPQICTNKTSPSSFGLGVMFLVLAIVFHFICDLINWWRDYESLKFLRVYFEARRDEADRRLVERIARSAAREVLNQNGIDVL